MHVTNYCKELIQTNCFLNIRGIEALSENLCMFLENIHMIITMGS